jgi:WXG100 family type VII secretion target
MSKTKASPAEIHAVAERHRTSAQGFRGDDQKLRNEVDELMAVNKGDLMTKLDELQNEWSDNIGKVIDRLEEMAGYLDNVANEIQAKDTDSSGAI